MKTITVGELRQNPTRALDEVEAGETYLITRHGREIGRIVPPPVSPGVELIPPKRPGSIRLAHRPRVPLRTAESIDELIEWAKGDR